MSDEDITLGLTDEGELQFLKGKKFRVEFYVWGKKNLTLVTKYYKNAREAMDDGYGHKWTSIKIFNDENELIHQNINSGYSDPEYN